MHGMEAKPSLLLAHLYIMIAASHFKGNEQHKGSPLQHAFRSQTKAPTKDTPLNINSVLWASRTQTKTPQIDIASVLWELPF